MGLFSDMIAEKRSDMGLSGLKNAMPWLENVLLGGPTKAGTSVNELTAMALTSVYACVKIIAWTLASLPLPVYQNLSPRGKQRASGNPIYKLIHDEPNPEQTSFEWRALMSTFQNLWGAGVSEIEYNAAGKPVALWPIPPWCVEPLRIIETQQLLYRITLYGRQKILRPENTLVFPALSTSRDYWLSPIAQHRETIGAALAVKEFGARTFGQGTNPAGILSGLKFPKEVSEDSLHSKFTDKYAGLGNAHRLMLLEDGVKFDRIGLPPQDAQYLETRKFDIAEIARIYNVPLHLLQEVSSSTSWGSGLEELNIGFVTFTLRPYLVQWEQEINRRLLNDSTEYFAEFLIEGLLRGKQLERFQAYAIARQWGWACPNDIREIENQNPLPGAQGDIYLVPMNMVDAKQAGQKPKPIKKSKAQTVEDPTAPQGGK